MPKDRKRTIKRSPPSDRKDKFGGMRYLRRGGDRRTRKEDRKRGDKRDSRRRRR